MMPNNHTYMEIHQQPAVWKKTYGIILEKKNEIKSFLRCGHLRLHRRRS